MVAAWVRIEGVAFLLASGVYLLIDGHDRRIRRLFFFSLPILLAIVVLLVGALFVDGFHKDVYRTDKIHSELTQFAAHYDAVRDQLKSLAKNSPGFFGEFLRSVRGIVWMVPLGLIFNTIVKGFFIPMPCYSF